MWIEVGFEQSIVAGLCNESGDAHHGQTSIVQFLGARTWHEKWRIEPSKVRISWVYNRDISDIRYVCSSKKNGMTMRIHAIFRGVLSGNLTVGYGKLSLK